MSTERPQKQPDPKFEEVVVILSEIMVEFYENAVLRENQKQPDPAKQIDLPTYVNRVVRDVFLNGWLPQVAESSTKAAARQFIGDFDNTLRFATQKKREK